MDTVWFLNLQTKSAEFKEKKHSYEPLRTLYPPSGHDNTGYAGDSDLWSDELYAAAHQRPAPR
jgi:hypothetical protein